MSNKSISTLVVAGILAILGLICFMKTLHVNDVQNIQVIQDLDGTISVRREGGWYTKICPRIWTYPKACSYFFSNDDKQSKDHDAPTVRYANTGTGSLNCQVLYRIDLADDATIIKLHEIAQGDDRVIEQRVLSTLTTIAQSAASKINSTDAIKQYDKFYMDIRKLFVGNPDLKKQGIFIEDFVLAGEPGFDNKTKELFLAQQTADLMKQTAEAEKIKLVSEKERTIAQYEKETAEAEGKATAQMAKERTDAEREATVAKINAERDKTVAETEAAKRLAVAELQRKTEEEQLKIEELKAKQLEVSANAKKIAIEKSGAITEIQQAEIELQRQIAQYKWENLGKGISNMKLPAVLTLGNGSSNGSVNPLDNLINALTVEKLGAISTKTNVK